MRRRRFIVLVAAAATVLPPRARAQHRDRVRRLGILMPYPRDDAEVRLRVAVFRDELRKLGWLDGENLRIDERWAADDLAQVRADAAEIVRLAPDVIFFTGGRVVRIMQQQTRVIPLVFVGVSDPLGQGLVASLARPGGNLTGIANPQYSIVAKLVEILKQIAPTVSRAGLMLNPDNPSTIFNWRHFEAAAPALAVRPVMLPVRQPDEIERVIEGFAREPHGGLVLPSDLTLLAHRQLVTATATQHRLPAIYSDDVMASAGGLASYSADRSEMFRAGASYVARILQGEEPGDLPVQEPTRYELVINAKTAKALGLDLPPALLARADEVIE